MKETKRTITTRPVYDFDQVTLRDYVGGSELWISQGNSESLSIEAPEDVLTRISTDVMGSKLIIRVKGSLLDKFNDMLSISFSFPRVIYQLVVKELRHLEICGAAFTHVSELRSEELSVRFRGAGEMNIQSLDAISLELFHDGAGMIELQGQVTEQHVNVRGVGSYDGTKLKSENAYVELRGTGRIVIQVSEYLDIRASGLGRVEYYGKPKVRKQISGLGSITHLGDG